MRKISRNNLATLQTRADVDLRDALLALDEAAPVELALAPLHPLLPLRRVAAVAAQHSAAVDTVAVLK